MLAHMNPRRTPHSYWKKYLCHNEVPSLTITNLYEETENTSALEEKIAVLDKADTNVLTIIEASRQPIEKQAGNAYIHEVLHAGTKESAHFRTVCGHSDVDVQRDTYDQECEITDSHTGNVYVGGRVHGPVWDNHLNHQNVACEAKKNRIENFSKLGCSMWYTIQSGIFVFLQWGAIFRGRSMLYHNFDDIMMILQDLINSLNILRETITIPPKLWWNRSSPEKNSTSLWEHSFHK